MYTYDKSLLAAFVLSEGRQRPRADEYELPPENADAIRYIERLEARTVQADQEKDKMEREKDKMEQEKDKMEQEKNNLKRKLKQMEEDMNRLMQGNEQGGKRQRKL